MRTQGLQGVSRERKTTAMGTAYAAFVIDVSARKIVGWRVSTLMTTSFVLDALNLAICNDTRRWDL